MNCQPYGTCQFCGVQEILFKTVFYYGIKCECHSPEHFEIVWHCKYCTPEEPEETKIHVKTSELRKFVHNLTASKSTTAGCILQSEGD